MLNKLKKPSENILLQFGRYVSLNVLGMIGLSCYILSDTFFIAKGIGADGLAALNLAIPIYSFINGLGLMIGMGGATRYAILQGAKEKKEGNRVYTQVILFASILSILCAMIGLLCSSSLSTLLGADESIHQMTSIYLKTILIFSPMFFLNNVLTCFVRNDNNPNLAMIAMVMGSLANIIMDYILVILLNGGLFGAALSTGASPIISMLILSLHVLSHKNQFKLCRTKLQFSRIKDICAIGSSSLIAEVSSGIVMIIFNILILNLKGNYGVAAYGIIANLSLVVIALFTGVSQGIQPLISNYYGANRMDYVKKIYRYAITTSILLAIGIYSITFQFSEQIVGAFNEQRNGRLAEIAVIGLRLYFTAFLFAGFNIVTSSYFGAIDQPYKSFVISILRGFIVIIPVAFMLATMLQMTGVWLAFTITEVMIAGVSFYLIRKSNKIS